MSRRHGSDPAAAAAAHYARLRADDAGRADRDALRRWRGEDAVNEDQWNRVERADIALGDLSDDPALAALRAEALALPATRQRRWLPLAAAAVAIGAVGLGTLAFVDLHDATPAVAPTARFATRTGEIRSVTLKDGSTMTLDAASTALVPAWRDQRRVELVDGRALFAVAKDAAHPFVVATGTSEITALGTHFSVERRGTGMVVALTEGAVRVRTPAGDRLLTPGQVLSARGTTIDVADQAAGAETAWQRGRLTFSATPLAEVTAQLQRYEGRRIVIRDAALAAHPFSGSLRTRGGTEALIAALQAYRVARVSARTADTIELSAR